MPLRTTTSHAVLAPDSAMSPAVIKRPLDRGEGKAASPVLWETQPVKPISQIPASKKGVVFELKKRTLHSSECL